MKLLVIFLLSFNILATTLVSHKGAWKDHEYPQNSKEGIQKALNNGYQAIELDLQLSKDGKLILAHDDEITKVSNCEGKISQMESQRVLNCLKTKNTLLPITQILLKKVKKPTNYTELKNVLNLILTNENLKMIWLDLKTQDSRAITAVERAIENFPAELHQKIILNSTNSDLLVNFRNIIPTIKYTLEGKWGSEPLVDYETYFDNLSVTHDAVGINVGIYLGHEPIWKLVGRKKRFWRLLKKFQEESENRDVQVLAWTVNNKKKIRKLIEEYNFQYLLTDHISPKEALTIK